MVTPAELQAIRERATASKAPRNDDSPMQPIEDRRTLLALYDAQSDEVRRLREALQTWQKFFDTMPKGQFGKISCDVGLMNQGFILMRKALGSQP